MLQYLKEEANRTYTENGAATYVSSNSDCLDLFATIGALRNASEKVIIERFMHAFSEDADLAMKILFFARDIRGGLGERNTFRVILKYLAVVESGSVIKNIEKIGEYGRFDDLLVLMGTPCESKAIAYIKSTLESDMKAMDEGVPVSLLAKWLPSINASSAETVKMAKIIAKALHMSMEQYRKTLSSLRAQIQIVENNLREKDYSFSYEKQASKALYKYRKAFLRNDEERYMKFLRAAKENPSVMHTGTLTPMDVIAPIVYCEEIDEQERVAMDTTWNALPNYAGCENALVVVDGSGSMYSWSRPMPAAVAQALGIYFAERNTGAFHNHFITFSNRPKLVEVKGKDIVEKVHNAMAYNECSNTDLEKTFELLLNTALRNHLKQSDMPSKLYIISDMEFDCGSSGSALTNFEHAKAMFEANGYQLPQVIFWNVESRNTQQPVTKNQQGAVLVSGYSPQIFGMVTEDSLNPYTYMMQVLSSERYEEIAA